MQRGAVHEAAAHFQAALAANPNFLDALCNLASLLAMAEQYEEAIAYWQRARTIAPRHTVILRSLAKAQAAGGQTSQAQASYGALRQLMPDDGVLAREALNVMPVIFESAAAIDRWRKDFIANAERLAPLPVEDIRAFNPKLNFDVVYHGRDNRALKERYYAGFARPAPPAFPKLPRGRIGFHIDRGCAQVFLRVMGGVLAHWEAKDLTPVVLCPTPVIGELQKAISNDAVEYVPLPSSLPEACAAARAAQCDLVYFWEVGTTLAGTFLPILRIAPVQCTGWGSVETTGIAEVDYFISSEPQEEGDTQKFYSEKLVKLKHLPTTYARPAVDESWDARAELGLGDVHLYICPQRLHKIHPDMDAIFAEIMARDAKGMLVFFAHGCDAINRQFLARFADVSRVRLVGLQKPARYVRLLQQAEVMLDTFYYGGGQTTMDGLSVGTPVVTMPGPTMRSRSSAACLATIGVEETVVSTKQDYVACAVNLATKPEARAALQAKIQAAASRLFETETTAREHVKMFRELLNTRA